MAGGRGCVKGQNNNIRVPPRGIRARTLTHTYTRARASTPIYARTNGRKNTTAEWGGNRQRLHTAAAVGAMTSQRFWGALHRMQLPSSPCCCCRCCCCSRLLSTVQHILYNMCVRDSAAADSNIVVRQHVSRRSHNYYTRRRSCRIWWMAAPRCLRIIRKTARK